MRPSTRKRNFRIKLEEEGIGGADVEKNYISMCSNAFILILFALLHHCIFTYKVINCHETWKYISLNFGPQWIILESYWSIWIWYHIVSEPYQTWKAHFGIPLATGPLQCIKEPFQTIWRIKIVSQKLWTKCWILFGSSGQNLYLAGVKT